MHAFTTAHAIAESLIKFLNENYTLVTATHVIDLSPSNLELAKQLRGIPVTARYRQVQLVHHVSHIDRRIILAQVPQNLEEAVSREIHGVFHHRCFGQCWIKDEPWDREQPRFISPALLITPDKP